MSNILKTVLLAGAAAAVLSSAALAADAPDLTVPAPAESDWDIAFGVTLTSDYIARGNTQTNYGPAIQPWVEFDYNIFYAGYWGSNVSPVSLGSAATWESDFSVGIRPELGPFKFDLGHVWYVYNDPTSNGSEAYIKASVSPIEMLTIGGAFYYGTGGGIVGWTYTEANASVDLTHGFSTSAAVGWVGGAASPYTTWNAGLTWKPADPLSIDVRYHAGPTANKVMVSASISSSLKGIGWLH